MFYRSLSALFRLVRETTVDPRLKVYNKKVHDYESELAYLPLNTARQQSDLNAHFKPIAIQPDGYSSTPRDEVGEKILFFGTMH